jgi:hypothetical protein
MADEGSKLMSSPTDSAVAPANPQGSGGSNPPTADEHGEDICEACAALRKVGPSLFSYLTLADDSLCGYHASELRLDRDRLKSRLLAAERKLGDAEDLLRRIADGCSETHTPQQHAQAYFADRLPKES